MLKHFKKPITINLSTHLFIYNIINISLLKKLNYTNLLLVFKDLWNIKTDV
jgi:hypothetical protein